MRAFQQMDPKQRLLMAFDIKSAHRLIPVQEEDWGLQAFRLDDEEMVYLNKVGAFGITTASFWWGRLAATLFRTFHRVIPADSLLYLLLFADDGLVLAGGEDYHKLILSVFIYLEIMEVPLSWKKTRGGFKTEWIGYTIDLESWQIGVSERKVKWLKEWVAATNKERKVLGREFKAGIGRMGFLAGAIKGVRPFLAPLYAVASRVGNTSYVELHMAVKLALEFFAGWLEEEPMRPPCDLREWLVRSSEWMLWLRSRGIMIGGWETFETTDPSKARWFQDHPQELPLAVSSGGASSDNCSFRTFGGDFGRHPFRTCCQVEESSRETGSLRLHWQFLEHLCGGQVSLGEVPG